MTKREMKNRETFLESLKNFDEILANGNFGIFRHEATLKSRSETTANIFTTIIGFIVGVFTGFGFFATQNGENGTVVVGNEGLHLFQTNRGEIESHLFFAYVNMAKAKLGRNIIFQRELVLTGREDKLNYSLAIMHSAEEAELIDKIAERLLLSNVELRKRKRLLIGATVIVLVVAGVLIHSVASESQRIANDPWRNFVPILDSPTFVSPTGDFQITFLEAYVTTLGVGRNQQETIMFYYDYEAFESHRADRPITRNFVIYQGDVALEYWTGGVPAGGGRTLLSIHSFEPGEIVHANRAVVPISTTQPLRIVRYRDGEVIFSYELPVRAE